MESTDTFKVTVIYSSDWEPQAKGALSYCSIPLATVKYGTLTHSHGKEISKIS